MRIATHALTFLLGAATGVGATLIRCDLTQTHVSRTSQPPETIFTAPRKLPSDEAYQRLCQEFPAVEEMSGGFIVYDTNPSDNTLVREWPHGIGWATEGGPDDLRQRIVWCLNRHP